MKWMGTLAKVLLFALVLCVPLLGVWISSSLAAYWNGPIWATIGVGLLLFPLLPGLWDSWAMRRRLRRGQKVEDRVLSCMDRLFLRTFALNTLFLCTLLYAYPQTAFTALSARGDWFLPKQHGVIVRFTRQGLFAAAGGLEWLYLAYHDNPYENMREQDSDADQGQDDTNAIAALQHEDSGLGDQQHSTEDNTQADGHTDAHQDASAHATTDKTTVADRDDTSQSTKEHGATSTALAYDKIWPQPSTLHPLVVNMPPESRQSMRSVARYLAANEPNPFRRVKAIHDFVADNVAYDFEALDAGRYPPQDAATVFSTGRGVCAGYANLFTKLGTMAGIEVIYVVGNSRDSDGSIVSGDGHAWNAVKIEGSWYLVDVTWNAGFRDQDSNRFKKVYRSDYLFTPPQYFVATHLPDQRRWQLLENPITRGDFIRMPMMTPQFYASGFRLLEPTRSSTTVTTQATLQLENPTGKHLMVNYSDKSAGFASQNYTNCSVVGDKNITATCDLPSNSSNLVFIFASPEKYGSYTYVGHLEVNRS